METKPEVYDVVATVVSLEGECVVGHKVGDQIRFCQKAVHGDPLCVDALTTLIPCVYAMRYGATFPWRKDDPDGNLVPCPDVANRLVFELRRLPPEA